MMEIYEYTLNMSIKGIPLSAIIAESLIKTHSQLWKKYKKIINQNSKLTHSFIYDIVAIFCSMKCLVQPWKTNTVTVMLKSAI